MKPKQLSKAAVDDRDAKRPKTTVAGSGNNYFGRDGLLAYIKEPENFPKSRVIYYNDEWVLIHDLYPKASLHLLLMPRNPEIYPLHPLYAFANDPAFLASAKKELEEVKLIAVSELRRLHGNSSKQDQARLAAMESDDPPLPSDLPPGRDWSRDLKIGVHANPSMNHLHIHILSRDMHSPSLRHRQHYQSFNTEFLAKVVDMPLSETEIEWRRNNAHEVLSERGSVCWRCGREFGSSWKKLKAHLEEEFEAWRRE
jgi:aprataxin